MSRTYRKRKSQLKERDKSIKKHHGVTEKELKRKNRSLNTDEGEE